MVRSKGKSKSKPKKKGLTVRQKAIDKKKRQLRKEKRDWDNRPMWKKVVSI